MMTMMNTRIKSSSLLLAALSAFTTLLHPAKGAGEALPLPIFFREINQRDPMTLPNHLPEDLYWLAGYSLYRLVPGKFPEGMDYHFDGE